MKWLVSIEFADEPFDGPFDARDYRLPDPETGTTHRMTSMPVHAIVTSPAGGAELAAGPQILRGVAWGGKAGIARVEVSIDGASWAATGLAPGVGPYTLTHWSVQQALSAGAHELAVRATDGTGATQPEMPPWNPRGTRTRASIEPP